MFLATSFFREIFEKNKEKSQQRMDFVSMGKRVMNWERKGFFFSLNKKKLEQLSGMCVW